jgi:hypothetical protein
MRVKTMTQTAFVLFGAVGGIGLIGIAYLFVRQGQPVDGVFYGAVGAILLLFVAGVYSIGVHGLTA